MLFLIKFHQVRCQSLRAVQVGILLAFWRVVTLLLTTIIAMARLDRTLFTIAPRLDRGYASFLAMNLMLQVLELKAEEERRALVAEGATQGLDVASSGLGSGRAVAAEWPQGQTVASGAIPRHTRDAEGQEGMGGELEEPQEHRRGAGELVSGVEGTITALAEVQQGSAVAVGQPAPFGGGSGGLAVGGVPAVATGAGVEHGLADQSVIHRDASSDSLGLRPPTEPLIIR